MSDDTSFGQDFAQRLADVFRLYVGEPHEGKRFTRAALCDATGIGASSLKGYIRGDHALPAHALIRLITVLPPEAGNMLIGRTGYTGAYARASRGFMGQQWDGGAVAFEPATWEAVFRVLKPGAHLVAFSGTRTYHRMVCAIEDAGFEIRDQLAWIYGSGFPKSHNQPGGWGTALKPAWEPIVLARKPLIGTVAANVLKWGTGAINVDGCRVEAGERPLTLSPPKNGAFSGEFRQGGVAGGSTDLGRWPANIVHDGSEEVLAGFPDSGPSTAGVRDPNGTMGYHGGASGLPGVVSGHIDSGGSAARFFYCAKATTAERGKGNGHPTVKPVDLMRWLCRLVTPKGGTILDPFAGSGSTLIAADAEQFNAIGCELSPEYAAIAERRVRDSAGMFAEVRAA